MLVRDDVLEAPLPQNDVVGCGRERERGLDAPGRRSGCDMEGPGDDGMCGLPRLSPHRRLCGRLRPEEGYSMG